MRLTVRQILNPSKERNTNNKKLSKISDRKKKIQVLNLTILEKDQDHRILCWKLRRVFCMISLHQKIMITCDLRLNKFSIKIQQSLLLLHFNLPLSSYLSQLLSSLEHFQFNSLLRVLIPFLSFLPILFL